MKKSCVVQVLLFVLVVFLGSSCTQLPREISVLDGRTVGRLEVGDSPEALKEFDCLGDIPEPTLTHFPARKGSGTAIVVCPGGGYRMVCYGKEGIAIARWLNTLGIDAFVLKYRLPAQGNVHPMPLQDAQRAIRMVRSGASKYGIDPDQIGIMGFSAGGHLTSTTGTHIDYGDEAAKDKLDRISSRPDFMVLVYPVITFEEPYAHMGSRNNLLGDKRDDVEMVKLLSNNLQVTADTPPNFFAHAKDDLKVKVENSIFFNQACERAGVASELKIYEKGGHGFSLGREGTDSMAWTGDCEDWLRRSGFLKQN
jgi:acetyl esterase/lipase